MRIDEGAIACAGPIADGRHTGGEVVEVRTVMPGLWDCHAHFIGVRSLNPLRARGTRDAA